MEFTIHGTIICVDCCQEIETYKHPDDLDGWRILRPAKAYHDLEGRCPGCDWCHENSDFTDIGPAVEE